MKREIIDRSIVCGIKKQTKKLDIAQQGKTTADKNNSN